MNSSLNPHIFEVQAKAGKEKHLRFAWPIVASKLAIQIISSNQVARGKSITYLGNKFWI